MARMLWQPEPTGSRGPRPAMQRSAVVDAAIEIADTHGLPAATLRAIAERLGVSIAGLYRYVPGKTGLIALMVEQARSHIQFPRRASPEAGEPQASGGQPAQAAPPDWRAQLEALAVADWELYHAHPWLLEVPMGQVPPGPSTVARFDAGLGAALQAGFAAAEAVAVVTAIDHLVIGAARDSLEQIAFAASSGMTPLQWWRMHGEVAIEQRIADGDYPWLGRVISASGFESAQTPGEGAETFRTGFRAELTLLLDGIAQRR